MRSFADGLRVGLLWVVLTLACEWHFGHDLMGRSWAGAAAEYNLLHGGTDAGWAGHFCGDARDGVAITRGVSESLKEGWLGARVAVRFRWLAGRGRKSGVKPAHSK